MWFTDVCWRAWLLLSRVASSPSPAEEDSSHRSEWTKWSALPHATESVSRRSTTRMDPSKVLWSAAPSLLAQQQERICSQRSECGDKRSQQPKQNHDSHNARKDQWIPGRTLVGNER